MFFFLKPLKNLLKLLDFSHTIYKIPLFEYISMYTIRQKLLSLKYISWSNVPQQDISLAFIKRTFTLHACAVAVEEKLSIPWFIVTIFHCYKFVCCFIFCDFYHSFHFSFALHFILFVCSSFLWILVSLIF